MQNNWVGYIDRTYQQIKANVLTNMQSLIPEITDHTESNPFVKILSIWSGIAEMLGYYIDNAAREAHLQSARLFRSVWLIAQSYGYRVKLYSMSVGEVVFKLTQPAQSDITIPAGTVLATDDGIEFVTDNNVVIHNGDDKANSYVSQYKNVASFVLGNTDGSKFQTFILPDKNIADNSIEVLVDNIAWEFVDNFAFSKPSDKHFIFTQDKYKNAIIYFGDGVTGEIPTAGKEVKVSYKLTDGVNVGIGAINNIVTNLGISGLSVTNLDRTVGGSKGDTLDSIKHKLPLYISTRERAVSTKDFKDLTELYNSVARAGVDVDDCGKLVIYVVPNGGGIAPASVLSDISDYIDEKKIVGMSVEVKNAGEVHLLLSIDVNISNNYIQANVIQELRQNLIEFLSFRYQEIKGSVYLSDLYNIIETTKGVLNSDIISMKPVPYAMPLYDSQYLTWDRELKDGNTLESDYKIIAFDATKYELLRNGNTLGYFNYGDVVDLPELTMKIPTAYAVGNQWVFKTYKSFGNLILREQSLVVSLNSDITINAIGGL